MPENIHAEGFSVEKLWSILQVIAPIFASLFLGMYARRKNTITPEGNRGLQQFVTKFALPCVLFNSCLGADLSSEALTTMALVLPLMLLSTFWAFRARKKKYPYHNLPMLFAAQESGMLGIPLFMTLFGADQAFRVGMLDLAQSPIAIPVIALLSAPAGENIRPGQIVKQVFRSPFLIMSLLGLILNLTGAADWLNAVGIGGVITETTGFLAQPVSAVMLFSVGYNFSLGSANRKTIFRLSTIHFAMHACFCLIIQGLLFLLPSVDSLTRWAIVLYCTLPSSFIAPGLGRTEVDCTVASGVCSVLTVVNLVIFCCIAVAVA